MDMGQEKDGPLQVQASKNEGSLSLDQVIHRYREELGETGMRLPLFEYCMSSASDDTCKKAMEYFYNHGYYEELEELIRINAESPNRSNQKWAKVYRLSADRYLEKSETRQLTNQEILKEAVSIKTDEPELNCLIEFLKMGVYNQMNEFGKMGNFLVRQDALLSEIQDHFLIHSFRMKLYQHLFIYYWVRNEVIMARRYAFRILTLSTDAVEIINMHISLGLTYTFDTFDQGMFHFHEALQLAREHELEHQIYLLENHNIPFLSAHFNRTEGVETSDPSEQAHIAIARGDHGKALHILNDMTIDSAFKMYYLGMAKQDKDILMKSYNMFIEENSNYFFSKLPLNMIQKM